MGLQETEIEREYVYRGNIIQVRRDIALLPNGSKRPREVVEHPGGAAIVAIKDDGKLLLVRQWRYPFSDTVLELPAGKLHPGEAPEKSAYRELEEETGFRAKELTKLGELKTSPGFCDEVIHVYLAKGLIKKTPRPDDDEFLQVEEVSFEQAAKMAGEGRITDAKTVAGILWAKNVR